MLLELITWTQINYMAYCFIASLKCAFVLFSEQSWNYYKYHTSFCSFLLIMIFPATFKVKIIELSNKFLLKCDKKKIKLLKSQNQLLKHKTILKAKILSSFILKTALGF